VVALLLPRLAAAARPVIEPGREDEVVALLAPHALGDALAPGWTLHSFDIRDSTIEVWIAGPGAVFAHIALDHPDFAPAGARRLTGFALTVGQQPVGSEAAVAELVSTIEHNDDGSFWREVAYASSERGPPEQQPWAIDGLVCLGLATLVLVGLAARQLRGAPAWMKASLLGIVLLGTVLRVTLSRPAPLGVWFYTRVPITARMIYEGPLLELVHPGPVWMSELILASSLYFALLAPLATYVHARALLDEPRIALIAAAILACLPLHLRFSHAGTAFIPSLTLGSLAFILVHVATRETNRVLGWFAVLALAGPLLLALQLRPLNLVYAPLLLAATFVGGVRGETGQVDARRRGAVVVIIVVVALVGLRWMLTGHANRVGEGLDLRTLSSALRVALHPRWNILINPTFTPPGLTLLAVVGGVHVWRRNRRLAVLLFGWMLAFLVLHAYFVPMSPYMQARYHLHLVPPHVLLAACGVEALLGWTWLVGRRRQVILGALATYVLASPAIHAHAIRNVDFNEVQEFRFVHSLRHTIPPQCTILEYVGIGADSRFDRVGRYVEAGQQHSSWTVVEIPLEGVDADVVLPDFELSPQVRALLDDPPACLYWYEGLPCLGHKPVHEPSAYACQAVAASLHLEEVERMSFPSQIYDESFAVGLGERDTIDLVLYRAHPRAQSAQQRKPVE
jgi:hypothetical protein